MSTLLGSSTQFLGQLHPLKVEHGRRRGRYKESEPKRDQIMGNAALASVRLSGLPENRAPVIAEARRGEIRWS